jgi:hypothetical protein
VIFDNFKPFKGGPIGLTFWLFLTNPRSWLERWGVWKEGPFGFSLLGIKNYFFDPGARILMMMMMMMMLT